MRILIKNGILHTMTDAGTFQGDVLLEGGRITQVAEHISPENPADTRVIDAAGLHVCPGLVDVHVHLIRAAESLYTDVRAMARSALSAGVTSCMLWQDSGQPCIKLHGQEMEKGSDMVYIHAELLREDALQRVMRQAAQNGMRAGCEVHSEKTLANVLKVREDTGCEAVLVHLSGCMEQEEAIVASGCSVILGACSIRSRGSAYEFACRLRKRGILVAVTTDYPTTRLHYLPMTAGLCQKAGMTEDEALCTVTYDAARLMGIEDRCGSIEKDKCADLTIFDGPPLRFSSSRVMTFCQGEMV